MRRNYASHQEDRLRIAKRQAKSPPQNRTLDSQDSTNASAMPSENHHAKHQDQRFATLCTPNVHMFSASRKCGRTPSHSDIRPYFMTCETRSSKVDQQNNLDHMHSKGSVEATCAQHLTRHRNRERDTWHEGCLRKCGVGWRQHHLLRNLQQCLTRSLKPHNPAQSRHTCSTTLTSHRPSNGRRSVRR